MPLSFGQEALVAPTYGTSRLLDGYVLGLGLVMFLANVFGKAHATPSSLLMPAAAVALGHGGTAAVLAVGLRRLGVHLGPRGVLRGVRRQYVALVLGILLTSAMAVTDQAVASHFHLGTIATLTYAQKPAALPGGLSVAVVSVWSCSRGSQSSFHRPDVFYRTSRVNVQIWRFIKWPVCF